MRPSDTDVETTLMVQPPDTNHNGTAFGGWIMAQMDLVAAICATKFLNGDNCVTVCVDDIQFNKPIYVGDIVTLKARVNWTGSTSLEVGVKVFAKTGREDIRHCLSGYLTFVNMGSDFVRWGMAMAGHAYNPRPTKIDNPVVPETEEEKLRWSDAEKRRADRLARKRT